MKVKGGYAKSLRVGSGWVGYGLVFGQSTSFFINCEFRLRNSCLKTIKGIVQYGEDDF